MRARDFERVARVWDRLAFSFFAHSLTENLTFMRLYWSYIWSSVCVCSRLVTPRPDRDGRLLYMNLKRIERTASGKEKANMLWCELW